MSDWLDPCAVVDATILLGLNPALTALNPHLTQNPEFGRRCEQKYAASGMWKRAIQAAQAGAYLNMVHRMPSDHEIRPVAASKQMGIWDCLSL